jgi:hypothetical protein
MASSEDAKLDELKRLLRRLDKALPPSPPAQEATPLGSEPEPVLAAAASPASGSAFRTVLVAAGVSALVSMSTFALFFGDVIAPQRFEIASGTWKEEIRRTAEQVLGLISGDGRKAPDKVPEAKDQAPPKPDERVAAAEVMVAPPPPVASAIVEKAAAPDGESSPVAPAVIEEPASPTVEPSPPEPAAQAPATEAKPKEPVAHDATGEALAELDASQFLRRGLLMLDGGSVGAAQLLLERAAELGSGDAAFALATTYDGAPGAPRRTSAAARPNADLAMRWYARAEELGIEEARKRISELKQGSASVREGG